MDWAWSANRQSHRSIPEASRNGVPCPLSFSLPSGRFHLSGPSCILAYEVGPEHFRFLYGGRLAAQPGREHRSSANQNQGLLLWLCPGVTTQALLSSAQGRYTVLFSRSMVHGVYALCYLSRQKPDDVVPASSIAVAMNIPPEQAAKILQALCHTGVIRSVRGRRGGYVICRKPEEISLGELFSALNPPEDEEAFGPRFCPVVEQERCSVYEGLASLHARVREFLGRETLATLIATGCDVEDAAFADAAKLTNTQKPTRHLGGTPGDSRTSDLGHREEGSTPS